MKKKRSLFISQCTYDLIDEIPHWSDTYPDFLGESLTLEKVIQAAHEKRALSPFNLSYCIRFVQIPGEYGAASLGEVNHLEFHLFGGTFRLVWS